jgi:hypothetical protein
MKLVLVTIFACACLGSLQAQTMAPPSSATPQASAPVKDPVTTGLRLLLTRSRNNTLGAITAMPADKFSYKPTPDQMSFAHLVVHIVGFNNALCESSRYCRTQSRGSQGKRFERQAARRGHCIVRFLRRRAR